MLPSVDFKRQLECVEQEATVLRNKLVSFEAENEKLNTENKKLALHAARLSRKDSATNAADTQKTAELAKLKESLTKTEEERDRLEQRLQNVLDVPADKLPPRIPKKCSDTNTKYQLQVSF